MITTILSQVDGHLAGTACRILWELATELPLGAMILDLNCGEGRSTVTLALAVKKAANEATILAADSHITDPWSATSMQDGNMMRFLLNLQRFQVAQCVVPIVAPIYKLGFINKRSANLIVIQSPTTVRSLYNEDAMSYCVSVAKKAVRKGGLIVVCCPGEMHHQAFQSFVTREFPKEEPVKACADFAVFECA
jgi:hypothetical protein